ncbi:MAG: hypothetical protein R3F56_02085 [Planctomycetota bacterium]
MHPSASASAALASWRTTLVLLAVTALAAVVVLPILRFPQLDPDDYRYLRLVSDLRAGRVGLLDACIIENRWDHLWWVDCTSVVRFFRPTLMLSYALDVSVHGGTAFGLLASNGLLYLATCLLAALLFLRLLPGIVPPLAAALAFTGCACHAETIWYVAGRNETLLALGFVGALLCHTARGRWRWLALPCYAFALASKELALPLPLLAWVLDRLLLHRPPDARRTDRLLLLGYALLAGLYLGARHLVLARAGGSDLVYPYFVAPSRPDFVQHLWLQLRTYSENLLLAGITPPFMRPDQQAERVTAFGTALGLAVPLLLVAWLRRERALWWFLLLALVTWLPASVVYISERYLFLPSLAVAGTFGLALARAHRHRGIWIACGIVYLAWLSQQSRWLYFKNRYIIEATNEPIAIEEKLRAMAEQLPPAQPIYLLNFPGGTFSAQFAEDLVRVVLADPTRQVRVLTVLPEDRSLPTRTEVRRVGDRAVAVHGQPLLMQHSRWLFPWTRLETGQRTERPRLDFAVEVLDGDGERCRALRFDLPQALAEAVFLRFSLPPASGPVPLGELVRHGSLDRLRP